MNENTDTSYEEEISEWMSDFGNDVSESSSHDGFHSDLDTNDEDGASIVKSTAFITVSIGKTSV